MSKSYCYQLYNLIFSSPLPCELLPTADSQHADVVMTLGPCPKYLSAPSDEKSFFQAKEKKLLLVIDQVARFYIEDAVSITVDIYDDADLNLLWTFILGSVIGIILHQRDFLVLHGNSIIDSDGKAMIFVAHSGGGKSTLTAALLKSGYQALSDDVSAIYFDKNNSPWVLPAYGKIKLWQDAVSELNVAKLCKQRVSLKEAKFHVEMELPLLHKPIPLKSVHVLEQGSGFVVNKITGHNKFFTLIEHTYRYHYVEAMSLCATHFNLCDKLLQAIELSKVSRPMNDHYNRDVVNWLQGKSLTCV
jgi:hypothetical protein